MRPQTAPVRYVTPVQQPTQDNSGADLVNILLMQQTLNSIADEPSYEEYREERAEARESQEQSAGYTPEPAVYEAAAASPEPVSYTPGPTLSYDSGSNDSD